MTLNHACTGQVEQNHKNNNVFLKKNISFDSLINHQAISQDNNNIIECTTRSRDGTEIDKFMHNNIRILKVVFY